MKKLLIAILLLGSIFIVSCTSSTKPKNNVENDNGDMTIVVGDKTLTKNFPSLSKYVLEGTALDSTDVVKSKQTDKIYSVLERLYSTVWFKSEKTYDDGIIETETEFIFFDSKSKMCKREYDNGIKDGKDKFSVLTVVDSSINTATNDAYNMNAIVIRNTEIDDNESEYVGYYLYSQNSLFVVEGDSISEVKDKLQMIVYNPPKYMENRYIISKVAKQ